MIMSYPLKTRTENRKLLISQVKSVIEFVNFQIR